MKGKNNTKKVIALCLAAVLSLSLLGGIGTFASAENYTESVYVYRDTEIATGVRINISNYSYQQDSSNNYILVEDTKRFIPTDISGNTVTPFICNGTTYLPLRAVSGIFGAEIYWNSFYSSVFITTPVATPATLNNTNPAKVDNSAVLANYTNVSVVTGINIYVNGNLWTPTNVSGQKVDVILMNGTTYLPIRALSSLFGATIDWDPANYSAVLFGAIPAEPAGDTDDVDDDVDIDIIQIIKDMIKDKLGEMLDIEAFIAKLQELKCSLGSDFCLSDIINVFKDKLGEIPDVDIFNYIKEWAEEHGCDLEDIKAELGAGSTSEMIAAFRAKLQAYIDGCSLSQFKEILKCLVPSFDLEANIGTAFLPGFEFIAIITLM